MNKIAQDRQERAATATQRADAAYGNKISATVHAFPAITAAANMAPALKR